MNRLFCCEDMETELCNDVVLSEYGDEIRMISDNGHGGIVPIKYCPFCGQKIKYIDNGKTMDKDMQDLY